MQGFPLLEYLHIMKIRCSQQVCKAHPNSQAWCSHRCKITIQLTWMLQVMPLHQCICPNPTTREIFKQVFIRRRILFNQQRIMLWRTKKLPEKENRINSKSWLNFRIKLRQMLRRDLGKNSNKRKTPKTKKSSVPKKKLSRQRNMPKSKGKLSQIRSHNRLQEQGLKLERRHICIKK